MSEISQDVLDELALRDAQATPAPWEVVAYDSGHSKFEMEAHVVTPDVGDFICDMDPLRRLDNERGAVADDAYHDAHLVVAMRNALPDLLSTVHALRERVTELTPAPCEMTHTPPFDFAECHTHDTTFPLGQTCRFDGREPWEVFADEADEQRTRAVRAEFERDHLAEVLDRWLPSILNGLWEGAQAATRIDRDERTPEQAALVLALSAAHHLAKDAAAQSAVGEHDPFDVPSVVDLTRQRDVQREAATAATRRAERAEAALAAADAALAGFGDRLERATRSIEASAAARQALAEPLADAVTRQIVTELSDGGLLRPSSDDQALTVVSTHLRAFAQTATGGAS